MPVRRTPASFKRQKYRPSEKAAKELSDNNQFHGRVVYNEEETLMHITQQNVGEKVEKD